MRIRRGAAYDGNVEMASVFLNNAHSLSPRRAHKAKWPRGIALRVPRLPPFLLPHLVGTYNKFRSNRLSLEQNGGYKLLDKREDSRECQEKERGRCRRKQV